MIDQNALLEITKREGFDSAKGPDGTVVVSRPGPVISRIEWEGFLARNQLKGAVAIEKGVLCWRLRANRRSQERRASTANIVVERRSQRRRT